MTGIVRVRTRIGGFSTGVFQTAPTYASSASSPALLLDGISGISAVWSFRRLKSAYAGNCVKIRRSSDNATQDFGFVSDVVDNAGIATFIGGGNGFVDTWYDQSGNSLNLVQPTAGSQLQCAASTVNSLPGMTANSGSLNMQIASLDITAALVATNQFTMMFVTNVPAVGNNSDFIFWDGPPGDGSNRLVFYGPLFGSTIRTDFANAVTDGSLADALPSGYASAPHVTETYRTAAGAMDILVDGASAGSKSGVASSVVSGSATLYICGHDFGYAGQVCELVMASVALSSTDRATIRKNGSGSGAGQKPMGTYFGITVA